MATDATITLGADARQFHAGLKEASGRLKNFMIELGGIGFGVTAAAASVGAALAAAFAPLKYAADAMEADTMLGVLLESKQAGAEVADGLRRLTVDGVRGIEELTAAAGMLGNVMQDPTAIVSWTSRFADLAAGSKVTADQVAKSFQMAVQTGRVASRDVDVLAKGGVDVYGALARTMGTSTQMVRTALTEGKVGVRDFMGALQALTDEGGKFYRMNAQMSGTFLGTLSSIGAEVKRLLEKFGAPVVDGLSPVLNSLLERLKAVEPLARRLGAALSSSLAAPLEAAVGALGWLADGSHATAVALSLLLAAMGRFSTVEAPNFKRGLARMRGEWRALLITLRAGCAWMGAFRTTTLVTGAAVKGLFGASWRAMCGAARGVWAATWATMATVARGACVMIKSALISTGIGAIVWGLGEALGWVYSRFADVGEAAGGGAVDGAAALTAALEAQTRAAEEAGKAAAERAAEVGAAAAVDSRSAAEAKRAGEELERLANKRAIQLRDAELAAMTPQQQIEGRLRDVGAPSEWALEQELRAIEEKQVVSESDVRRYEALAAAASKVAEIQSKAAKEAQSHAEACEAARRAFQAAEWQRMFEAEPDVQERQRLLDFKAAAFGVSAGEARNRAYDLTLQNGVLYKPQIEELLRIADLWDGLLEKKRAYGEQAVATEVENRARWMELSGDAAGAARLREEQVYEERVRALRSGGASRDEALRVAAIEQKLRQLQRFEQGAAGRVSVLAQEGAHLGNGGLSLRIGDDSLKVQRESKVLLGELKRLMGDGSSTLRDIKEKMTGSGGLLLTA